MRAKDVRLRRSRAIRSHPGVPRRSATKRGVKEVRGTREGSRAGKLAGGSKQGDEGSVGARRETR